jgi:hypothetical protein
MTCVSWKRLRAFFSITNYLAAAKGWASAYFYVAACGSMLVPIATLALMLLLPGAMFIKVAPLMFGVGAPPPAPCVK